jgi:SAM-dependent methyltransferase
MQEAIVRRLVELNAAFYEQLAAPFAASRATPQPGYERLLAYMPPGAAVLDLGCGPARFGRLLSARGLSAAYTGVDFSPPFLAAAGDFAGQLIRRDLTRAGCLADLGDFDLIVCLSTLQHIPGRANRLRLLAEMRAGLRPGGYIILANWQFTNSPRQRRKVRPWAAVGLSAADVEPGDYLLAWQRGGDGLRYVALLDAAETLSLAEEVGLRVNEQFHSDGREGNLNLYTILTVSAE